MFGLFKNKKSASHPSYKVMLTEVAKYRHITSILKESEEAFILIYHFENTGVELGQLLSAAGIAFEKGYSSSARVTIIDAETFAKSRFSGKQQAIVCEIYPTLEEDDKLLRNAHENDVEIDFYSALDSKFFDYFGDGKLTGLMNKLGFGPNDVIDNALVGKAIRSAQQKIKQDIKTEKFEKSSLEAWMQANINIQRNN